MAAGSGSNNADAPQIPQLLGTDADFVELHDALFQRNARLDGVAQTLRLVEDFLNHVMRKSPFIGHSFLPEVNCSSNSLASPNRLSYFSVWARHQQVGWRVPRRYAIVLQHPHPVW